MITDIKKLVASLFQVDKNYFRSQVKMLMPSVLKADRKYIRIKDL